MEKGIFKRMKENKVDPIVVDFEEIGLESKTWTIDKVSIQRFKKLQKKAQKEMDKKMFELVNDLLKKKGVKMDQKTISKLENGMFMDFLTTEELVELQNNASEGIDVCNEFVHGFDGFPTKEKIIAGIEEYVCPDNKSLSEEYYFEIMNTVFLEFNSELRKISTPK